MQTVRIVTHSGCDLSFAEARANGIIMVPDLVIFGDEQYRNADRQQPDELLLAADHILVGIRGDDELSAVTGSQLHQLRAGHRAGTYEHSTCKGLGHSTDGLGGGFPTGGIFLVILPNFPKRSCFFRKYVV